MGIILTTLIPSGFKAVMPVENVIAKMCCIFIFLMLVANYSESSNSKMQFFSLFPKSQQAISPIFW